MPCVGDSIDPEARLTLAQRVARAAAEPVEDNPLVLATRRARGRSKLATVVGQSHPMRDAARMEPPTWLDSAAVREMAAAVTGQAVRDATKALRASPPPWLAEAAVRASADWNKSVGTAAVRASGLDVTTRHAADLGNAAVRAATAGTGARALADLGKIGPLADPAVMEGVREALVRAIGQQRIARVERAPAAPLPSPRARRVAPGRRTAPSVDLTLFRVQAENSQRQLATAEATRALLEEMVQRVRESEARAVVAEKGRTYADRRSLLVTLLIGVPSAIASMPTVVDAVRWFVRVLL